MKFRHLLLAAPIVIAVAVVGRPVVRSAGSYVRQAMRAKKTIPERVAEYGPAARGRLHPYFQKAGVAFPPKRVVLVGIKDEARLQVYAAGTNSLARFIRSYPVRAASGGLGPKLKAGDRQVPEGIYPVESLNPNSRFHLALRVGYPNAFDREQAAKEGRTNLGGDIMIHGGSASIGCLAMGDDVAEELFVLAADTGLENVSVILTPVDFRLGKAAPASAKLPAWTASLYGQIKARLAELPVDRSR